MGEMFSREVMPRVRWPIEHHGKFILHVGTKSSGKVWSSTRDQDDGFYFPAVYSAQGYGSSAKGHAALLYLLMTLFRDTGSKDDVHNVYHVGVVPRWFGSELERLYQHVAYMKDGRNMVEMGYFIDVHVGPYALVVRYTRMGVPEGHTELMIPYVVISPVASRDPAMVVCFDGAYSDDVLWKWCAQTCVVPMNHDKYMQVSYYYDCPRLAPTVQEYDTPLVVGATHRACLPMSPLPSLRGVSPVPSLASAVSI